MVVIFGNVTVGPGVKPECKPKKKYMGKLNKLTKEKNRENQN